MPFIIDGGGGTPSPTPTPVPAPIATSQVDVYVDNTSTGVATRTGNIAAPFLTIQEALNKIGKPTSSADSLRLMCVHVSSGNYTETLNVPEGRMIKIVCHGWVNFTGNVNYLSDGNARLGSGIRSFLSISGIDNNLATSTHIGRQGGMTINGRIIRKCTSVTGITTHDLYLSNVVVTGGIGYDSSIAQAGGTSLYLVRSRLQGTTSDQVADSGTGFPLAIQQIEDSKIEGTLKVSRLGGATRTEFASCAMTVLQAGGDIPPFGYYDCLFTGSTSLIAPAGAFKLNGVSYKNAASVPLSGGVAREYIEDFTPLATGTTDNAVTRFDGTTGLLQTSGLTIDDTNNVKGAASVQLTGGTGTAGTLSWNDGDGTLDIALKGGQTVLQVGQEQVVRVLNNTGAALSDGQVVYITGAQGQRPTVALADADIEATSSATIGIVTEPIANGAEGFVTLSGLVRNIDTSAWAEGAQLYVSGTAGALTTTKPVPPAHAVRIGWVVRQHATSGSILVHVQNGYELDELHDVLLATPTNRQSLAYETASGLWKNTTLTKSDVGLANVDNTSDANKPISSATQTALDGKQSVALGLPDIRPSLLLDFANSQTVDPRITFTRDSTATRTNARQLIEIVSANTPRIDYDPVTGQCKGLLIEESRTNLLTYSEQFDNAAWVKAGATVAPNATIAPDGTITADKLVEDIANSQHFVSSSCTTSSGAITASVFVKAAGRTAVQVNIYNGTDTVYCRFDINSGTFITSATVNQGTNYSSATSSATNVGNGWYRVSIGVTSSVGSASTSLGVYCYNSTSTYTGDGTSGLYIWGAQLEAGAFPTSYIPSTINFTGRASTGTYIGSDGLIKTAASGEARYQYNPLNLKLAPKLLLEEQRTNLLLYSGDRLNAAWHSIFINGSGGNFWTVTASTEVGTPGHVGAE